MSGNQGDYGPTRDAIASGRRVLAQIDRRAPEAARFLVRNANPSRTFPPFLQDLIAAELVTLLADVTARGRRALDHAEEFVNAAGSPTTLDGYANSLDATVGKRSLALFPTIRNDALSATYDDAWSGTAAQLYRDASDGQGAAVERIATCSAELSKVLRDLARHLEGFMGFLTASILTMVGSAMGILAAFSSLVAPEAALAVFSSSIVLLAAAVVTLFATMRTHEGVLENLASDATIAVAAWPQARFGGRR